MEPIADVLASGSDVMERYATLARKTFPQVFTQASRGAVRYMIAITPPATASQPGGGGSLDSSSAAKARGGRTIERDLNRIFVPVRIKNKRHVRGLTGTDLVAIHLRHLAKKPVGKPVRRDRPQPYYVDVRLFNALATKLRTHVGRLAAGWYPAASALQLGTPAWVARHGMGRGTYQASLEGEVLWMRSVNLANPYAPTAELQRRVPYAVQYAMNDMRRQILFLDFKNAVGRGDAMWIPRTA